MSTLWTRLVVASSFVSFAALGSACTAVDAEGGDGSEGSSEEGASEEGPSATTEDALCRKENLWRGTMRPPYGHACTNAGATSYCQLIYRRNDLAGTALYAGFGGECGIQCYRYSGNTCPR